MARTNADATGFRLSVLAALGILVLSPVLLIVYQSFLTGPFFSPMSELGLDAYVYIFSDPDFYRALATTAVFALGTITVCVPLGAVLAFLVTRTDLAGRRWLEGIVLVPMFLSAIVLGFGYTVAVGPAGIVSLAFERVFGFVPWNIYGLYSLILISGLTHVPYVYLYSSAAMRNLPGDLEEAARTSGAGVWTVARYVTWPLIMPALIFSVGLNVMLAFEAFGLPLVLGDPAGVLVLTTYIYKLTTILGIPSYQLMAVVAVVLLAIIFPLVFIQRKLLSRARRFAAIGGKGARVTRIRLGKTGQVVAWIGIATWLFIAIVLPIGGIAVRAFVDSWGSGVNLLDHLTLNNFEQLFHIDALQRGIVNTVLLAVIGGALAVGAYLIIALAGHRWSGAGHTALDYMVLMPRALPGLIIGLAFFWIFLFVPFLQPLRLTLISLLVAYIIVGLSYGLRLIQATLLQVAPELEESARSAGATIGQTWSRIVIPIIRPGLLGAWTMIMIIFLREYATGVYLMTNGTEVIGSLIVSLMASGSLDTIAALALISVVMTTGGLVLANRLGGKIHE
ncbi:iron ABC transporter permease [Mesorhizobium sp. M0848]|uniref:ABC transporter permease n=1 Tax=Mesorhizobium sp. M0848 TaxID=2957012 RepID=UPI003337F191